MLFRIAARALVYNNLMKIAQLLVNTASSKLFRRLSSY